MHILYLVCPHASYPPLGGLFRQPAKKIFLIGTERLSEETIRKVDGLLGEYSGLKGFYWAKEKIRELYRQKNCKEAAKLLDNIIFNLKSGEDGELIRWGNSLKHWRQPILNYFNTQTTNGFTEGCNIKIKMFKRVSYGLRNVEVYWRKMLLGFVPAVAVSTQFDKEPTQS